MSLSKKSCSRGAEPLVIGDTAFHHCSSPVAQGLSGVCSFATALLVCRVMSIQASQYLRWASSQGSWEKGFESVIRCASGLWVVVGLEPRVDFTRGFSIVRDLW